MTNTVKISVPIVARPKPVQVNKIKLRVVTNDNYAEFIKSFTKENGNLAHVAISINDYENLSLNIAELRRYLNQQTKIIVYYEDAVRPEDQE